MSVSHLKRAPGLIYLNFQSLHLLQLNPIRPWILSESCGCSGNDECTAGFWGFYLFEQWVYSVVNQYLHSPLLQTNSSSSSPPVIVLMTPNAICERSFYGQYLAWFDPAEQHYHDCATWLQASFSKHCAASRGCNFSASWQSQLPVDRLLTNINASSLPTSLQQAERLCREGVFGRNGSLNLASRMRRLLASASAPGAEHAVAWRTRVGVVDAFTLTDEAGCRHTPDGRHYDVAVLDKVVDELAQVYNKLKNTSFV